MNYHILGNQKTQRTMRWQLNNEEFILSLEVNGCIAASERYPHLRYQCTATSHRRLYHDQCNDEVAKTRSWVQSVLRSFNRNSCQLIKYAKLSWGNTQCRLHMRRTQAAFLSRRRHAGIPSVWMGEAPQHRTEKEIYRKGFTKGIFHHILDDNQSTRPLLQFMMLLHLPRTALAEILQRLVDPQTTVQLISTESPHFTLSKGQEWRRGN